MNKHELADERAKQWNEMCWDEMVDAEKSLKTIAKDIKVFQGKFDDNFYHSDKKKMSDQWDKLNAMLHELIDEVDYASKNIESYYE